MYNMDKKGFLLGCLTKLYWIFSKKAWEDGHLNGAGQDRNRNWITVLATICTDGTSILPAIIYCVNDVITPIPLPLFSPVRSTVPLSRNRGSATRIGGKHKDKVLYRGIGGV